MHEGKFLWPESAQIWVSISMQNYIQFIRTNFLHPFRIVFELGLAGRNDRLIDCSA